MRGKDYLQTPAWKADRKACFNLLGWKCLKCGSTEYLTCDHIYARSLWRWLQKVRRFHQPLCDTCNKQKGIKVIDYRPLRYRLFRPMWFYIYLSIRWLKRIIAISAIVAVANNGEIRGTMNEIYNNFNDINFDAILNSKLFR